MGRTLKDISAVLAALALVVFFLTMHTSVNTPPKDGTTVLRENAVGDLDPLSFTIPSGANHWQLWWSYTCYGGSYFWSVSSFGYPASHRYTVYINEVGGGGSGVKDYSGTGKFNIQVQSGGTCSWTLNITLDKKQD